MPTSYSPANWAVDGDPSRTPKSQLNAMLHKVAGRSITKDDQVYESMQFGRGQYQSTLTLHCLPQVQSWAGEVCGNKQDSEQSAAVECLKFLETDPGIQDIVAAHMAAKEEKKRELMRQKNQ